MTMGGSINKMGENDNGRIKRNERTMGGAKEQKNSN
jgi:hypothetical protein